MKFFLLFFSFLTFADDFEKDLEALKAKYKPSYKKEENQKWEELAKSESFWEKYQKTFRKTELTIFFDYYFFQGTIPPDGKINGQLSSAGPYLETNIKLWKWMDLWFYGNYGVTSDASFQETTNEYKVPNNYLIGLGGYFNNQEPTVSPFFSFEYQGQSFVGVNQNVDFSTINALTQLQGGQVTSFNMNVGLDIPVNILNRTATLRAFLNSAISGQFQLMDGSYSENVSYFQGGFKLKYPIMSHFLLDLAATGGNYKGQESQSFLLLLIDLGYRF